MLSFLIKGSVDLILSGGPEDERHRPTLFLNIRIDAAAGKSKKPTRSLGTPVSFTLNVNTRDEWQSGHIDTAFVV